MSRREDEQRVAARKRLAAGLAAYKAVPESEKVPVREPDKYAFPVGLDDEGNPFPSQGDDAR